MALDELLEITGLAKKPVQRLIKAGRLPGVRVGRVILFDVEKVMESIRSMAGRSLPAECDEDEDDGW